jgi:hypothetical protein
MAEEAIRSRAKFEMRGIRKAFGATVARSSARTAQARAR